MGVGALDRKETKVGIGDLIAKAKDMFAKNQDQAGEGIDKVGDPIDEKTAGKHTDQVDKAEDAAKGFIEDLRKDD
ncbi:MAG TPA: antitoxin [Acidimicrobiia bacterium]|nr:antitoxin [Acidimicrobiia bacterium]